MVTLLEKLDAIGRRYLRDPMEPAAFVRHYEDAAAIIAQRGQQPPLEMELRALVDEMLSEKQIACHPVAHQPALALVDPVRKKALSDAHAAIAPMYWGTRRSLELACEIIRGWIEEAPLGDHRNGSVVRGHR